VSGRLARVVPTTCRSPSSPLLSTVRTRAGRRRRLPAATRADKGATVVAEHDADLTVRAVDRRSPPAHRSSRRRRSIARGAHAPDRQARWNHTATTSLPLASSTGPLMDIPRSPNGRTPTRASSDQPPAVRTRTANGRESRRAAIPIHDGCAGSCQCNIGTTAVTPRGCRRHPAPARQRRRRESRNGGLCRPALP